MFNRGRKRPKKRVSLIKRFFRSIVAIVILGAFIMSISLMVNKTSTLDLYRVIELAAPLLSKVGVSTEEAGQVAGSFAERVLKTNIAPSENYKEGVSQEGKGWDFPADGDEGAATSRSLVFKTAFLSDSHNNSANLTTALALAAEAGVHSTFFLGDYTDLGVEEDLKNAKKIMDESGLLYYSLPGDRDLYDSVGPLNYYNVFGKPRISVTIGDIKFVLIDNSANYTLIDQEILGQYELEIAEADFVVLSQPLYHPLASYGKPVMGLVKGEVVADVKEQAQQILEMIRNSGVKAVVAGDHHSFSRYKDEVDKDLEHVVVGPVTEARAEQKKTSLTLLNVYDDGTYSIEEVYFD